MLVEVVAISVMSVAPGSDSSGATVPLENAGPGTGTNFIQEVFDVQYTEC
jgi:hypothetical protein